MGEKLHREPLYIPSGGMNPDANGTAARAHEASDIVNIDLTISEVLRRPGTKLLGELDSIVVSIAGFGDANGTYYPESDITINGRPKYFKRSLVTPSLWYIITWDGIDRWEISSEDFLSTIIPYYYSVEDTPVPPEINWVVIDTPANDPAPTVVTNIVQPQEIILEYHKYNHPIDGTKLFAFCANQIYRYDDGTGWVACIDDTISPAIPINFEQWSITNCIDRTLGATVVAAGSKYTKPVEAYTAAADRYLFYYDFTADLFKQLEIFSNILDNDLLGTTAGGALNIVTDSTLGMTAITPGTGAEFPIRSGTAYFVIDGIGVIATAGTQLYDDGAGNDTINLLLPVDSDEVLFGVNSWIDLSDGTWSIDFGGKSTYQSSILYVFYEYDKLVDYRPLYVSNYHNALVMSNTSEFVGAGYEYFPWRVRWSEQLNIQLAPQNYFQELALDDITPILGMRALETTASSTIVGPLYFYKHNSIIRGTYNQNFNLNPDLPAPFFNFEIAYSEGIEATRTIATIEGRHLYLGRNDVYIFDGVNRQSLTEDLETRGTRVQKYMFDRIDFNHLDKCFGVYDEINRKYMLYLKFLTDTGYSTNCFVYDIDLRNWRRYVIPETSAGISTEILSGNTINNLAGTIAELDSQSSGVDGPIEDLLTIQNQTKSIVVAMLTKSYIFAETGGIDKQNDPGSIGSYDSYFISRDFFGETLEEHDRTCRVYIEGISGLIEMGISPDYTLNVSDFDQIQSLSFPSKYFRGTYNPDSTGIHARFYVNLIDGAMARWMQVFSMRQELTNE